MEGASFVPGLRFRWRDNEYIIRKFFDDSNVEVSNLNYLNQIEIYSMNELLIAWYDDQLIINSEKRGKSAKIKFHDIGLFTVKERQLMEKRYKILEPIINGKIMAASFNNYINSLSVEDKKVIGSKATLYRWLKRWNETTDKRSLLTSGKLKKKYYSTAPVVITIIEELLKQEERTGLKTTIRDKWIEMKMKVAEYNETRDDLMERIQPCSFTTLYRIVQDKTNTYQMEKSRLGKVQAALNQHGVTSAVKVDRPLERVEIDWTPLDILIVDISTLKKKRFYLVYAIDTLTDYPLGFYISSQEPNINAIKQCLLHSMLPKLHLKNLYPELKHDWTAYGVPETVVLDNAKVNESRELEEICALIGIEVQYCPVKTGHNKGKIERALQTINNKIHKVPGTTFSNSQEKSQYDSEREAVITLKALYEILHYIFIELIANDFNQSVGGTPALLWERGIRESKIQRKLPYQKNDLKLLLSTGVEYRKITNKGIEIQSQFYQSNELMKLKDLKARKLDRNPVRVRFDMADMREVHVYDEYEKRYIKASPTRNSLLKKKIDDKYPIHYEQLHANSYKNEYQYRNFDTTDVGIANQKIKSLVHESKERLREIQRLSDDDRAIEYARDISKIQSIFETQLAPEHLDSIELLEEDDLNIKGLESKKNRNKNKLKIKKNNSSTTMLSKDIVSHTSETIEEHEEELEGYESIVRTRN